MLVALTRDEIETVVANQQPLLIIFTASWCNSCQMIKPEIKALHARYHHTATLAVVDVEQQPEVARNYGINRLPTLLFFKNGLEIDRHIGAAPLATLCEKVSNVFHLPSTYDQNQPQHRIPGRSALSK